MDGKVVLITGANTGIGKETALDLARRGAKVYLACRDVMRGEQARRDIIARTSNHNVFNRVLDLASLSSIRRFVEQFYSEENRLDVLINNAGVMMCPKTYTEDGLEMQMAVNHWGHFLLTNLLMRMLVSCPSSRIINVTCKAYANGVLDRHNLNSERSYCKREAYDQSKLAVVLFNRMLSKKLYGALATANCADSGAVATDLTRHLGIVPKLSRIFNKTPKSGAQTQIRLAVDPELSMVTGKYFRLVSTYFQAHTYTYILKLCSVSFLGHLSKYPQ